MKKFLIFSVMLTLAFAAVIGQLAQMPTKCLAESSASAAPCGQGLCVVASATVQAKPDFADISFSVETKSTNIEEAQEENAGKMNRIIESLNALNIQEADIKTAGFHIFPELECRFGQCSQVGYKVCSQLNVKVRDLEIAGSAIDTVTAAGANVFSGIHFGLDDTSVIYNEALTKAVGKAKDKALALSAAADIENIRIISIKEISNSSLCRSEFMNKVMSLDGMLQTPIMHGEIEVSATVKVVYEIAA